MSVITPRREYLVARVYFVPVGTIVALGAGSSSLTVSKTSWPDNTPPTNYSDWKLHDTETIVKEKTYDTETFKIEKDAGGYQNDIENTLIKVMFTGETHKTREIFKQLEWGTATPPVINTAIAPFTQNDDFIEGVALIEFQGKSGAMTESTQFWARLRLKDDGKVGPETRKLVYTLELRDSGNNTYVNLA